MTFFGRSPVFYGSAEPPASRGKGSSPEAIGVSRGRAVQQGRFQELADRLSNTSICENTSDHC